jgi:hypothetical protein
MLETLMEGEKLFHEIVSNGDNKSTLQYSQPKALQQIDFISIIIWSR